MPDDTKQNVLFPEDEPESVGSELVPLRGSRSDVSDEKLRRLLEFRFSTEDGESRDLGFTLPTLIYCTLPHRRSTEQSYRRQDPYTGARLELFAPTEVGLPFGSISRLFLARVMTSVVQTNRRTIYLGRSWRTAAENLGLATSGPGLTRFQDHVARCFYATFTLEMRSGEADPSRQSRYLRRFNVLSAAKLPPAIEGFSGIQWSPEVEVDEAFYRALTEGPRVPFDFAALRALSGSPLGMDLYLLLNYRVFSIRKPLQLPFVELMQRFGGSYGDDANGVRTFKRRLMPQLLAIKALWPDLKVDVVRGGLQLQPGRPHVPSLGPGRNDPD